MVGAPPAIPENYVSSSPRDLAVAMGGSGEAPQAAFNYQQDGNQQSHTLAYLHYTCKFTGCDRFRELNLCVHYCQI